MRRCCLFLIVAVLLLLSLPAPAQAAETKISGPDTPALVISGSRIHGAGLRQRLRLYMSIVLPVVALAIRRSEKLSTAMEARAFCSQSKRTFRRRLTMKKGDWLYLTGFCAVFALLTAGVKGFLLSAFATLFVVNTGRDGYVQALCTALLPGFFSLSALLLLGRQALGLALVRLSLPPGKGRKAMPDSTYFFTFLMGLGLLLLAAVLSVHLSPKLWAAAQTFLPNP